MKSKLPSNATLKLRMLVSALEMVEWTASEVGKRDTSQDCSELVNIVQDWQDFLMRANPDPLDDDKSGYDAVSELKAQITLLTKTLDAKRGEIAQLTASNKTKQDGLDAYAKSIKDLNAYMHAREKEFYELKAMYNKACQGLVISDNNGAGYRNEIRKMTFQLGAALNANAEWEKQIAEMRQEISRLKAQVDTKKEPSLWTVEEMEQYLKTPSAERCESCAKSKNQCRCGGPSNGV